MACPGQLLRNPACAAISSSRCVVLADCWTAARSGQRASRFLSGSTIAHPKAWGALLRGLGMACLGQLLRNPACATVSRLQVWGLAL